MPNLLNQSKHHESKPRLALQIRNQEQKKNRTRFFTSLCENSHQGAKIRTGAKLMIAKFSLSPFVDFLILFSPFPTFTLLV